LDIIERRTKPRVETKVKVKVLGEEERLETFTGNLSKSGVFLQTQEPFSKVGDKVQLQLILPHANEPIRVTGKVARITSPNRMGESSGMGIEFLRVEARQSKTFDRLIDRLLDARGIGSRKYPRIKTQIVVEFKSKDEVQKAIADDLSKGGLFLRTQADGLVLGDTLRIVLLHPSSRRKFEGDAEVVHIRKGESNISKSFVEGVGVKFLISASQRNEMTSFLKSLLAVRRA